MKNYNNWDVPFSTITWFENAMYEHDIIAEINRSQDIVFHMIDIYGNEFNVLLLNEYVLSEASIRKALNEFEDIDYIVNGGNWNKYTGEANRYARKIGIKIYNFGSFMGAINNDKTFSRRSSLYNAR